MLLRAFSGGPKNGQGKFFRQKLFQNNLAKLFFTTLFAIATLGAMPAYATTVTIPRTQVLTTDGQDFTYSFTDLAASDGTGGTITIATGDARNRNSTLYDGIDLSLSNEFFRVTFDTDYQGRYSCQPGANNGESSDDLIIDIPNTSPSEHCAFELVISLSGAKLDELLADSIIDVILNLSNHVNHNGDQDEIIVTLSYTEAVISEVPLPAALPLFIAGIAGIGAVSRRRRNARQKTLAA